MQREVPVPLLPPSVRWAFVVVAAVAIFYASVLAAPPAGPDTGPVGVDKLYHVGGYFGFGLAVAYALVDADERSSSSPRSASPREDADRLVAVRLALVFAVPALYGVGIEIAQAFVPVRMFDPTDAVANTAGAAAAGSWYLIAPRLSFVPCKQWLADIRASE